MEWSNQTLGDYCEVIAGQSPEGKYYNTSGQGLPFYQGKKEFGDRFIGAPKKWTTKVTKEAVAGDILMSVRAPVGPINFSTQNICIGRGLAAIRPNEKLSQDFLFYYLLSKQDEIIGNEGAVFASINKSQIEALSFSYVDLIEQKRIVALLDTVFADLEQTRAKTEQNLKNARELFDSYLQQVFSQKGEGWEEGTFNNVLEIRSGRNQKAVLDLDGKYPIYGSAGKVMNWANSYICEENTTIIGRKGTINSPMYMTTKFWNVDTAFGLIAGEKLNNKFLFYFCKSFDFSKLDKGTTLPSLVKKDLVKIIMPFPKLDKQKNLVKKLDELSLNIKKVEDIYQEKLNSIDELKKSILQKAFSGKLIKSEKQSQHEENKV